MLSWKRMLPKLVGFWQQRRFHSPPNSIAILAHCYTSYLQRQTVSRVKQVEQSFHHSCLYWFACFPDLFERVPFCAAPQRSRWPPLNRDQCRAGSTPSNLEALHMKNVRVQRRKTKRAKSESEPTLDIFRELGMSVLQNLQSFMIVSDPLSTARHS